MTTAPPSPDTSLSSRKSLAHGPHGPHGAALLHIERARRGTGDWNEVHRALTGVGPLIDGRDASLFLGAPAMALVLNLAADGTDRYAGALHTLDRVVAEHAQQCLAAAHARIDAGRRPAFAEYDLFRGLAGIGALLLRRQPRGAELKGVLEYLVRLTESTTDATGETLPGWWVGHAPASNKTATPGGHANAGMAHGITGPLALLALALRAGVSVAGHEGAMLRIYRWLDQIRQSDYTGTHWPRWASHRGPAPAQPATPSWCYGTPGLARAQQLVGIVLEDGDRKRMAERALLHCLSDPGRLDKVADHGLCHGFGGLLRTAQRVAQDAEAPAIFGTRISLITNRVLTVDAAEETGFLTGKDGAALGDERTAHGHTAKALDASHITGDTDLTAYILGRKAQLAVDTGHPADALGLAGAARRTPPARKPSRSHPSRPRRRRWRLGLLARCGVHQHRPRPLPRRTRRV